MAFGFFKKNESADVIFMGGRVYTHNPDFPWAEAVACKDGLILDVGDYEDLSELKGKHTEIIDLEGGVMLPGYIDVSGHPASNAFRESCLFLNDGDLEEILAQISEYTDSSEDTDVIFAYGFQEHILEGVEAEQVRARLDGICGDKPVIVLGKSGFHCLVNTFAFDMIKAAAEEEEVKAVSVAYVLGVLEPIDLNTMPEAVPAAMGKRCERGFTAVFDCGAPDFFASIYQNIMVHLYQEGMLKQRFYGSLRLAREVNPKAVMQKLSQYRTHCAELNGYINFKTLSLIVEGEEDALTISGEALRELCLEAGDKGFDISIEARGEAAVDEAVEAMSATRSAGYKRNAFTLIHDPVFGSQELTDTCFHLDVTEITRGLDTPDSDWLCIENAKNVEEAVEMLTLDAATQLGIDSDYGSIEKGKHADFVIYDEDPFDGKTLPDFKKLKAAMTVLGGAVVYDAKEDDVSAWHSMLTVQEEE